MDVIKLLAPQHDIKFVVAGDGGYLETFRYEVENNKLKEQYLMGMGEATRLAIYNIGRHLR